jgi:hypothetical protein
MKSSLPSENLAKPETWKAETADGEPDTHAVYDKAFVAQKL